MSKERLDFDVEREMKHLKKIVEKDEKITITSRFVKHLIEQAEHVQELEYKNDILQHSITDVTGACSFIIKKIEQQNNHFREALEFYADEENNRKLIIDGDTMYLGRTLVEQDGGCKARKALEQNE